MDIKILNEWKSGDCHTIEVEPATNMLQLVTLLGNFGLSLKDVWINPDGDRQYVCWIER